MGPCTSAAPPPILACASVAIRRRPSMRAGVPKKGVSARWVSTTAPASAGVGTARPNGRGCLGRAREWRPAEPSGRCPACGVLNQRWREASSPNRSVRASGRADAPTCRPFGQSRLAPGSPRRRPGAGSLTSVRSGVPPRHEPSSRFRATADSTAAAATRREIGTAAGGGRRLRQ